MAHPRMTAEIGRLLGGRYRLIAPIGSGASAQVFLAHDVKLRRRVALKMLHEALADDADFARRFRAEARAAAALSHPNVMAVYDWAEGDVAFIVTEYLPGGSLRALLDGDERLTPAQALGFGLEAARALDYAHRRGFVHRDIKPANLLFGEEQRLRIADFGLARALAEAAWTEPQGAMLGTARYASPEQAKGEKLSGKADVYSLALILVEAVTGEVPFLADTTLGTLMARVDKALPVPDALGPLQAVLDRAGHPDPSRRIDARALATGLLRAARELPRPAPLLLAGALSAAASSALDDDPSVPGPAPVSGAPGEVPADAGDLTDDDLELGPPDWVNQAPTEAVEAVPAVGVEHLVPTAAAPAMARAAGAVGADRDRPGAGDRAKALVPAGSATGALAAERRREGGGATALATPPGGSPDLGPPTEAVSLDEVDELDLTDAALDQGARDDIVVLPDAAVSSAPAPSGPPTDGGDPSGGAARGADAPAHRDRRRRWPYLVLALVLLTAATVVALLATRHDAAPPPAAAARAITLPVPGIVGETPEDARAVMVAAGWKPEIVLVRRDGTEAGQVIGSDPVPGTRLASGRTVKITVSQGPTVVDVPADLAGRSRDQAVFTLGAVGLTGDVVDERYDEQVAKGVVIALAGGTASKLEKGSTVALVVSKGPLPRKVPSGLAGSTVPAATQALADMQLKIATDPTASETAPQGEVISVTPDPGAAVARDSVVTAKVSTGPSPRTVPRGLQGSTVPAATQKLADVQLEIATISNFNDTVAQGKIVSVAPAPGKTLPPGSVVTVEVSKGPELVAVPDVGQADSVSEAIALLDAKGLKAGSLSGPAAGSPQGTRPGAGSLVRPGATVDLVLG